MSNLKIKSTGIFFDLTELFLGSSVKFKYYGIARVVKELAHELITMNEEIRFVIFSPAHHSFFEVFPEIQQFNNQEIFHAGIIVKGKSLFLRSVFHKNKILRNILLKLISLPIQLINLIQWWRANFQCHEIKFNGETFISAARPKFMVEYLSVWKKNKIEVNFIPLLHDLIPFHDTGMSTGSPAAFVSSFLEDNKMLIQSSKAILTNSYFTTKDIRHFCQLSILPAVPDIFTIQLAHELRAAIGPVSIEPPVSDYLLCVGTLVGRRNLQVVIEAMLLLHQAGKDIPLLVLAGAHRNHVWKYLAQNRFSEIYNKFRRCDNPDEPTIKQFYKNALAVILPSRIEGWGLPAAEALWTGTPVICSDVEILHEVCGDMGLYFEPDSPAELAEHIDRLMNEDGFRRTIQENIIHSKDKLRSWNQVAQDLLGVAQTLQH